MDSSNDPFKFKEGTREAAGEGGLCVVEKILYYLFKSPFVLWRMSANHLKDIRKDAKLDIEKIDSPIPFILFLIRFTFDFLLHALIYISVVIAPIVALGAAILAIINGGDLPMFLEAFFGALAALYYAPVALRLIIEALVLIKKYGPVILRFIFFPITIIYYFLFYIAKKCKFKTAKYEKKFLDINKEQPMNL